MRLAASPHTAPELLRSLGGDRRVTVRAALALNPAAPAGLRDALAEDGDERVRALLARRLALLIPHMDGAGREQIGRRAIATLSCLVDDEATRVRAAIADVLKEMPEAPRALILKLAHDSAVPVSEPVIRLSPLLTPEDLLALLAAPPGPATAAAIARRPGLDGSVCEAIAATADSAAIAALLSNRSAAIREATLDALVARAAGHEEWHDPLVRRPQLSARAARVLSEIVATHLLEVLAGRADLPPPIAAELRHRLVERLAPPPARAPASDGGAAEQALAGARALFVKGRLNEAAIQSAAQRGDRQMCGAMLAVAADVPMATVERAATLRSAKALVSLVWAAGFSMRTRRHDPGGAGGAGPRRDAARHRRRRLSAGARRDALADRPAQAHGPLTKINPRPAHASTCSRLTNV